MILGLKINYEKCEMIGLRTADTFLVYMADASTVRLGSSELSTSDYLCVWGLLSRRYRIP